jgi:DNA-binding XRE family transcriptional regulator
MPHRNCCAGTGALRDQACPTEDCGRLPRSFGCLIRVNEAASALSILRILEAIVDRSMLDEINVFAGGALPGSEACPPCSETVFLAELGERVRSSRTRCDLSRRELARRSGISERYIAQIEAGKGNVSIVLLLRLVSAIRGSEPRAA